MDIKDYPLTLNMKHVAEILGCCLHKAYDVARRPDFPAIRDGKRIFIPRDAFWRWFNDTATQPKSTA
jgi:hypothetical protein